MIIARRLAALGVALVMIAAALTIRDRWIDGDDPGDRSDATVMVCADEVATICSAVSARHPDLAVRSAAVGESIDSLTGDELWLTYTPFPEIVDQTRQRGGRPAPTYGTQPVASTILSLVVLPDRSAALVAACGEPVDWRCIGDAAGRDWSSIGGDAAWGKVRPAFAPIESGIGRLGVASAISGYFGDAPIDANDPAFISWARRLGRAVSPTALSAGTAVATIQVRASSLDVAIGAAAQVSAANAGRFDITDETPFGRIDLVLAVPDGVRVPAGLVADLSTEALAQGWLSSTSVGISGDEVADANTVVTTTQLWEDLT